MKNKHLTYLFFSLVLFVFSNFYPILSNASTMYNIAFEENTNNPPVAVNDTIYTTAGATNNVINYNILANDYDPEDDEFILTFLYAPSTGLVDIDCDGELVFINSEKFIGTLSFDYIICEVENNENCDRGTIVIQINGDNDFDGIVDDIDIDDDNDGILDIDEGINIDTDGDGIFNSYDIDSDADGIPDNIESQPEGNYILPLWRDSDNDGWDDAYDPDNNGTYYSLIDTDNDGTPDFLDTNTDNDSLNDVDECTEDMNALKGTAELESDSDHDGLIDAFDVISGWANKYNPVGSNVSLPDLNNNGIRDWRENPDNNSIEGEENALTSDNFNFSVYPNPAVNTFFLELPVSNFSNPVNIKIVNIAGKIVYENTLTNSVSKINPGNLNQGIYLIHLRNKTVQSTQKLVIRN